MISTIISLLFGLLALASSTEKAAITVSITNLRTNTGVMEISLYNVPETFPVAGKHFKMVRVPVTNPKVTYTFNDLAPGEYAIGLYHDEDSDGKFKTNFIGYPKEPYGFSNNVKPVIAAPDFEDAKFTATAGKTVVVEIRLIR